jgi:ribosome-associated protein
MGDLLQEIEQSLGRDDSAPVVRVAAKPGAAQFRGPNPEEVRAVCALLEEHKGDKVCALDLRELHSWTDFFVIATVTSNTHLEALARHVEDFAAENGLMARGKRSGLANGWNLIDMGTAVIHLMSEPMREFYELEELWLSAGRFYP